jgi:SWI/SNF-related matrix-associated actin-dependent regulator 1 of chromatin subfamily A
MSQEAYLPNGYEDAVSTKRLATNCCMCGRPLGNLKSIERGVGPDCYEKYGFAGGDAGPVDQLVIDQGINMAPEPMRSSVLKALVEGNTKGGPEEGLLRASSTAVWHAAMAVSYTGPEWRPVVAAAQKIAEGCGYHRTADRIKYFYSEDPRGGSGIKLEQVGRDSVCAKTPYDQTFINAVKRIQGRKWNGRNKVWCVPNDKLAHLIAALSVAFADQFMLDLEGNMVTVPRDVQIPPPKTRPAGAPKSATNETDAWTLEEAKKALQKGEKVIDPEGREGIVRWVGPSRGGYRVGLSIKGIDSLVFFSYEEVKLASSGAAQKKTHTERCKDAANGGGPAPAPPAPPRLVPKIAFPFQVEGISWLDQKRSGLLADEPGLGKTLQACVASDAPVVVVCPAALRVEWAREFGKWRSDLSTLIVSGTKAYAPAKYKSADVVIINYDILVPHSKALLKLSIKTLIADEAHYLKTLKQTWNKAKRSYDYSGSNRSKAFVDLAQASDRLFLLTATPLMNRPIELWPLLHFLDPTRWDKYSSFGKRFCDGKLETRYVRGGREVTSWNFQGASNGKELNAILTANYMLRRTKDILPLPPKSRQTKMIALDPKTAREYKRAAKDFENWVREQGGAKAVMKHKMAPALTKMTALRKLAARGKLEYATEWIVNHYESTGRPLVVMGFHRDVTKGLQVALEATEVESPSGMRPLRVGMIIGGIPEAKRTAYKDAFQAGELDVLVCSIPAAGAGLTLTAASETLFLERTWRPMDQVQAEDRIWRISQKNKCTITYLQAANTVDGIMAAMLVDKQATIAERIDGLDLSEDQAKEYVFGRMFNLDIGVGAMSANPSQRNFPFIEWQSAAAH